MRKVIKEIRTRHEKDHGFHSVDQLEDDDPDCIETDDVPFREWLEVHEDRKVLLDEIDRLYAMLRKRRKAA